MIEILMVLSVLAAIACVFVSKIYRVIMLFGIFSMIASAIYMFLGAPDVAMSEAGISAFAVIFMIVCAEKFYGMGQGIHIEQTYESDEGKRIRNFKKSIPAFIVAMGLLVVMLHFVPVAEAVTDLRDQYLLRFTHEIGGENAVTAIYLAYRVYDTLFEALLLVIAVAAVAHMSWYSGSAVSSGHRSEIETSHSARFTLRVISPIMLLFGVYLVLNGHISAGGGFVGGLAFAVFFICRYLISGIHDMPVSRIAKFEELVYICIIVLPVLMIFAGVYYFSGDMAPNLRIAYLIAMNALIAMKVACGFFVIFYRFIAIERLVEEEDEL